MFIYNFLLVSYEHLSVFSSSSPSIPVDRERSWSPAPIVVGRTGDDTRKSPIITLYEPSVGLFIHHHITSSGSFIHEIHNISIGTLTIKLNHTASPHCYIYGVFSPFVLHCVTWHVAMICARVHINSNLYCGPTVQPCRVTTRVTVTHI